MLIVDTGVLVAATDPHHTAGALLLSSETVPLLTTGMVIAAPA